MQPLHAPEHAVTYTHSNTLLLRGLAGRDESELRALFSRYGPLKLLRVIERCDVALAVYAQEECAARARADLLDESVVYTKPVDDDTLQHHVLSVPQIERNFLLSPPPSPPQDWQPIEEDINHVPLQDLQPQRLDGKTILLEGSDTTPSIIGDW